MHDKSAGSLVKALTPHLLQQTDILGDGGAAAMQALREFVNGPGLVQDFEHQAAAHFREEVKHPLRVFEGGGDRSFCGVASVRL